MSKFNNHLSKWIIPRSTSKRFACIQISRKMCAAINNFIENLAIPRNKHGKNDFIKNILTSSDHRISLEVSPSPMQIDLINEINPNFVSVVTIGNPFLELAVQDVPTILLAKKFCESGFPVMVHLPGRNIKKDKMLEILTYMKQVGIKNIIALQGDWSFVLEPDDSKCDFPYASDLVSFIKDNFGEAFCVGVAGHPNVHSKSKNLEEDMKYLKLKISKGAEFIITQATFDYDVLETFANNCRKNNINVPILPGFFIITSNKTLDIAKTSCKVSIPQNIEDFFQKNKDNQEEIKNYGLEVTSDLIRKCLNNKLLFGGVQIFSMNHLDSVKDVLTRI